MNKAELVSAIADDSGLTKADAKRFVESFCDVVSNVVATGEKVSMVPFGSFSLKTKNARTCRNPKTGEPVEVPEKKVLAFTPSKTAK